MTVAWSEAWRFWLKLGFISFGGPAGQIALMHAELVERKRWISEQRFLHALNYCMLLPGPEAQQLATYLGWLMHRTWGGIVAGGLFVLPSLFILIGLTWIYMAYGNVPAVSGILYGIKPAVTAIVVFAAYRIGSRALKNGVLWATAAAAFIAIFAFSVPFPLIVVAAGLTGYIGSRIAPDQFRMGGGHGAADKHYGPAMIDDETPTPAHARFSWVSIAWIAVIGLEQDSLVDGHLREPVPAVRRTVRHHQPLERPLRLAWRIEYGIGGNQVGERCLVSGVSGETHIIRGRCTAEAQIDRSDVERSSVGLHP